MKAWAWVGVVGVVVSGCSGSTGGSTSGSTGSASGASSGSMGTATGASSGSVAASTGSGAGSTGNTGASTGSSGTPVTTAGSTGSTASSSSSGTGASTGTSGTTSSAGLSCSQATLFLGNPVWGEEGLDPNSANDSPAQRPMDGADALSGIPYHYQDIRFSQGQIITHDQLSVWRVDSSNQLHAIAGNLNGDAALQLGACSQALFADVLGFALGSDGSLYLADWGANAVLKISSPLDSANCSVSSIAGNATNAASIDLSMPPSSGNADGTGSAASFNGPESMTIDSSDNLYLWDSGNWSVRKVTSAGVVTTLMTLPVDTVAYASLAFLNGTLYFWGRGNDPTSDADLGQLYAIDPTAGAPNPTPLLTVTGGMVNADPSMEWDIGGITTDGTTLYVIADGQLFAITAAGQIGPALAGVDAQSYGLDFTSGYGWNMTEAANQVELLTLSETQTWGVNSYLTLDSSNNVYFTGESEDVYVEKIACTE